MNQIKKRERENCLNLERRRRIEKSRDLISEVSIDWAKGILHWEHAAEASSQRREHGVYTFTFALDGAL
jgi:hypothetical protein